MRASEVLIRSLARSLALWRASSRVMFMHSIPVPVPKRGGLAKTSATVPAMPAFPPASQTLLAALHEYPGENDRAPARPNKSAQPAQRSSHERKGKTKGYFQPHNDQGEPGPKRSPNAQPARATGGG
ncbi:hypothetical protein BKA81DRAFT_400467 [Phyllosticta paracitricarpa]